MNGNGTSRFWLHTICVLAIVLGIACEAARADDAVVGDIGDLTAVEMRGCRQVSADVVRRALVMSDDVQVASSPSAPLDEFVATVRRKLLAGYLDNGFANVDLSVAVDATGKHLVARVEEGTQFMAGPVQIIGAVRADAKALQSALTERVGREPAPPEIDASAGTLSLFTWTSPEAASDALWEVGKPAPLTTQELDACKTQIEKTLLREGFFWSQVSVEPEPRGDKTVRLNVRITDEGPKAVLGEIQTTGLAINTPKEALEFGGLKPGMAIDLNLLQAARKKFWDSGRFLRHDIRAHWSRTTPGRVDLTLDFWEHANVPPLSEPIAPDSAQGIMLRCGESLKKSFEGGDSVAFDFDQGREHVKFVLQSDRGLVARWTRDRAEAGKPTTLPSALDQSAGSLLMAPEPLDLSIVCRPQEISLLSALARRRYTVRDDKPIRVMLDFVPSPDDKLHPVVISMWGGTRSDSIVGAPPVEAECEVAPVACLDLATPRSDTDKRSMKTEIRGGVLYVTDKSTSLQVEAKSGRLLRSCLDNTVGFGVEPGGLDRETAADEASAPGRNDCDPAHPIASLANFLVAWNSSCPVVTFKSPESARAIEHLTSRLTWQALESLEREIMADHSGDNFGIPRDAVSQANSLAFLRMGIGYVDSVFDRGSWPWTICHEGLLFVTGGSPYVRPEIMRLLSSENTGPIGYAAIAAALRPISPEYAQYAQLVAKLGLEHLSANDFKRDFRVLLQGPGVGPKTLANLLQAVADLDDADSAAICNELPRDWADAIGYVRQIAREHPGKPVVDALAESSDQWWNQSVREIVQSELEREARESP